MVRARKEDAGADSTSSGVVLVALRDSDPGSATEHPRGSLTGPRWMGDVERGGVPTVGRMWLPNPDNCRNFSEHFTMGRKMALRGSQSHFAEKTVRQRVPALVRALEFQALLDAGTLNARADIARQYGISRARVTQVLRVLKLVCPRDPKAT